MPEVNSWKQAFEWGERFVFSIIGLGLIAWALRLIYIGQITDAGIVFGLGFLSSIYANVARFKRFKGLGFEAELWEDKQKEAADLIERLREVVSIYTREVILLKVKAGRWGRVADWEERWKLFDDLGTQHSVLGQEIDFTDTKKEMDDYFLFDMTMPQIREIKKVMSEGKAAAGQKLDQEFPNPIRQDESYRRRLEQFRNIGDHIENPFEISVEGNLASHALDLFNSGKKRLHTDFAVDVEVDPKVLERLEEISKLYQTRPVRVTAQLIGWANDND